MILSTKVRGIALSAVAIIAALSALAMEDAKWSGPAIAMQDFAYVAWPIMRIALVVAALLVAIRHARLPYSVVIRPMTVALILLAMVQWLHGTDVGPIDSVFLDIALLIAALAFLARAHFQIHRHRDSIDLAVHVAVLTPLGLAAGWITVSLFTAIGEAIWTFARLQEGALATAWQSALLVVMLLFVGLGIEQSRAHPSYALGALWGIAAITLSTAEQEDTTLMLVSIVVALITVALYFIERAMFRYRARPGQRVDR